MKRTILAALCALLTATGATAEPKCAPTILAIAALVDRYGESIVDTYSRPHKTEPGVTITYHVWVNAGTGTWTFTGAGPDGFTCLFFHGKRYNGQKARDFFDTGA